MLLFSDAIGLVDGDPYSQYPKWNNLALVDADGDDLVDLASSEITRQGAVWVIRNLSARAWLLSLMRTRKPAFFVEPEFLANPQNKH